MLIRTCLDIGEFNFALFKLVSNLLSLNLRHGDGYLQFGICFDHAYSAYTP